MHENTGERDLPGDPRPIGVFDSGVGGLTVARALMDLLPDERIVYFGDTARGPYGPRDLAEVRGFTAEIVEGLARRDTKLVVAACNTASAAALESDPLTFPVPVSGVIAPAVATAARATRTGRVGVIGTVGTIGSGAYDRAVAAADPRIDLTSAACPRFVEMVEAGRVADAAVRDLATAYLAPLVAADVDTVILGCTHYPLLTGAISYVLGPEVLLVSSAEETARWVFRHLVDAGQLASDRAGGHVFVSSGDRTGFTRLAQRFLGTRITEADVESLDWSAA